MKDSEIEVLIVGLSAHGVMVQMGDGRLGFMLNGGSRERFADLLARRYEPIG